MTCADVDVYGLTLPGARPATQVPPPNFKNFSNFHVTPEQSLTKTHTIARMPIPDSILKEDLEAFLNREISSKELARRTGYHEVSLRRAIKRPPKPPQPKNKSALIATRKAFRATLAHLPVAEIQRLAHVSLSTANRIKKANR